MENISIWNDLSWILDIRSPALSVFFETISLAGYPTFLILFISFGYFFWSPLRFSRVAMLLFISGLINAFLKVYFQDPRPPSEFMLDPRVGNSFGWPSGHSQIAVTLWGLLAYELKKRWISLSAGLLIVAIAFSRMYLGVHDLGDVISGLFIGLLILILWQSAVNLKIYEQLSKEIWILLILTFQLIFFLFYPQLEGHEPSIWFLGVMLGWYLGISNINIKTGNPSNIFICIISTIVVFLAMIIITQLEENLGTDSYSGYLISYFLGIIFSLIVTWFIPRTWRLLKLAS